MANHYPKFFEYFKDYQDAYVIIGGQAASILLDEAAQQSRATVDLDIIVVFEKITQPFLNRIKEFLREFHYELDGRKDDDEKHYYRFRTAKNSEVPVIIELFSKMPIELEGELRNPNATQIPLLDDQDSLSAISLDRDYYTLLKQGVYLDTFIGGPILKVPYLILFKAKAQLDIARRQANNESVNRRDKSKHKTDIYRLLGILDDGDYIPAASVAEQVKQDLSDYVIWLEQQPNVGSEIVHQKLNTFARSPKKALAEVLSMLRNLIR